MLQWWVKWSNRSELRTTQDRIQLDFYLCERFKTLLRSWRRWPSKKASSQQSGAGQTPLLHLGGLNIMDSRRRQGSCRWHKAFRRSCKCPGYTSLLHYVEMCMAAVACANLLQYALQLLPRAFTAAPLLSVTSAQRQLLGLSDSDLGESVFYIMFIYFCLFSM